MFNPNVEAGPGRLISQHRYADGIMPDYPAVAHNGHSRCGRRAGTRPQTPDDGRDAPTADYVDGEWADGASRSPDDGCGGGGGRTASPGYVTGERPLTDFIISLLETFQLTSRATLRRSAKTNGGRPLPVRAAQRTTAAKLGGSRLPRSVVYPNHNGRRTLFVP